MTHEPECDYAGVMTIGMPCRQCAAIRIAYQRGREDAAKAILSVAKHWSDGGELVFKQWEIDFLYTAARGDGAE